jgi:hypothetical protein
MSSSCYSLGPDSNASEAHERHSGCLRLLPAAQGEGEEKPLGWPSGLMREIACRLTTSEQNSVMARSRSVTDVWLEARSNLATTTSCIILVCCESRSRSWNRSSPELKRNLLLGHRIRGRVRSRCGATRMELPVGLKHNHSVNAPRAPTRHFASKPSALHIRSLPQMLSSLTVSSANTA